MGQETEWNKGRFLSCSSAFWQSCTLHAGVKLGIFSLAGDKGVSLEQACDALEARMRGVELLFDALSAMGLLEKRGSLYSNSPAAEQYLNRQSPKYIGHIIMHHHHLVSGWARLDEAVVSGRPVERPAVDEEFERQSFLLGMHNLAEVNAIAVAKLAGLDGRKHLLDLGGGPGTFAIHFCLANPQLRATIFDRPTTRPYAAKLVAQHNLQERIGFQPGNFNTDSLGGPYDAAWLSHILHSNSLEECFSLVARVVAALEPGGLIMIHDFFLNEQKTAPVFPALFSLNMLINNPGGRSFSEVEVREMLLSAGVGQIRRLDFSSPNDSGVLCGVVP